MLRHSRLPRCSSVTCINHHNLDNGLETNFETQHVYTHFCLRQWVCKIHLCLSNYFLCNSGNWEDKSITQFKEKAPIFIIVENACTVRQIHTLRVHYAHVAANLNTGYSKYAKVAHVHYFCTIALPASRAVLTRAWASRRVDLRERRVDLFSKQVIIFCWFCLNDF